MSLDLEAIAARACADTEADAIRCPHGREPIDRCELCSGDDSIALVAEVKRLRAGITQALVQLQTCHGPAADSAVIVLRELLGIEVGS